MRFGFHFNGSALVDQSGIHVRGQFGPFVDALAREVDHIDLLLDEHVPGAEQNFEYQTDYRIQSENVSWVSLGPSRGSGAFVQRLAAMRQHLPEHRQRWDFVLLREPSRRSPFIRLFLGDLPRVFLLGADFTSSLDWSKGLYVYSRAWFFTRSLRRAVSKALVLVNNDVLLEEWRPYARQITLTRTSTLMAEDILPEALPRCQQPPYTLLFVGRIEPVKGLEHLLKALAMLNRTESCFRLQVVGMGADAYLSQLRALTAELGIEAEVEWAGYQGRDTIMQFYRDADIFVSPALYEDLARTIWEAMAQSCPVIVSRVGGQARLFVHEQDLLFCEPADSQDLATQIQRLVDAPALRQQLAQRGLALARSNTLEVRSRELIDTVAAYLR